jgi:carbon-monoxide dehydrogenase large subunit
VVNAVIDALSHLGVEHIDMPTTPWRVWQAIQEAQGRAAGEREADRSARPPQATDRTQEDPTGGEA